MGFRERLPRWAKIRQAWLRTVLELPQGIPSRDCIRRVLSALRPEAFQQCFQCWIADCRRDDLGQLRRTIAIDGKTLRRSHDHRAGLRALHLVSAWASDQGLAWGQVAAEEKSNEITAIPELLEHLDVEGAIVTIDAMGCQTEIAQKIVDGKGDYVLAVQDNQPKLFEAISDFFSEHLEDDMCQVSHRRRKTHEKGHGRRDDHYYYLAKMPQGFSQQKRWSTVKAIGMAVRVSESGDGRTTDDVRYYIASRYLSGQGFADAVRGHWGIENSLHWVLDVTLNEDQSRTRNRRLANNLAWLRRFAVSLLKQHPAKESIKRKEPDGGLVH